MPASCMHAIKALVSCPDGNFAEVLSARFPSGRPGTRLKSHPTCRKLRSRMAKRQCGSSTLLFYECATNRVEVGVLDHRMANGQETSVHFTHTKRIVEAGR